MYGKSKNTAAYPPAKPNGDTNRELVDIEIALAKEYNYERNIIVFNVRGISWILPLFHECDIVVVSPKTRLLCELEIKRSWSDFQADFKKRHHHEAYGSIEVSSFSYVVPEGIYEKVIEKLRKEKTIVTSIITYDEQLRFKHHTCLYSFNPEDEGRWMTSTYSCDGKNNLKVDEVAKGVREGRYFTLDFKTGDKPHKVTKYNAHPLFTEQLLELTRLGCMRQVSLREKISEITIKNNKKPQ